MDFLRELASHGLDRQGLKQALQRELAAARSECSTAMQQGKLGRVRPGHLYPELDAALFAMREDRVGGPIETEIGFHLLYCERIHPAGEASFAQAAAKLRERLQQSRARQCQKAWLAALEVPTVS